MKSSELPKTDSIQELARFWDSHQITDFEDQLEEVVGTVFERRHERMVLRLEPDEARVVEEIAKARGLQRSDLVREWVLEKLATIRPGDADRK